MDKAFIIIQDPKSYHCISLEDRNRDYHYEGLHFYYKEGWYLELKEGLFFEDDCKVQYLKARSYFIKEEDSYYKRQVLVYKKSEGWTSFAFYQLKNILITPFEYGDLIFKNPYFAGSYIYIKDFKIQSNYPFIYLNQRLYREEKLKLGDEIFCLGLRMVFLKDCVWINHFYTQVLLEKATLLPLPFKGMKTVDHYSIPYRKVKELPNLNFEAIQKPSFPKESRFELARQLAPSLTISFAMVAVSLLNAYLNYQRGRSFIELLPLLILPFVLLLSSLIWPFLFHHLKKKELLNEKKEKIKAYNDQVETMKKELCLRLSETLQIDEESYFDASFIKNSFKERRFFYYHQNDRDFLEVSLGKTAWQKDLSFIEQKEEIERQFKVRPLFLNLKNYRYATIIESLKEDYYFLRKIILELLLKYHPEDLLIVFYKVKDDGLKSLHNAHFFQKDVRIFLNSEEELQKLENITHRHIVIFSFAKIYYTEMRDHWHLFYYSQDEIHRLSEVIIKVKNGKGTLLEKEESIRFDYPLFEMNFYNTAHQLTYYYPWMHRQKKAFDLKEAFKVKDLKELLYLKTLNKGLEAPIGRIDEDVFSLNLNLEGHGPHGLIAGSTGSGKTELIVSILASFALRYSAFEVGFIIIDFKGGMIAERLSYKGARIPHLYAEISNLNEDVKRFLVALNKECQKRQILFQKLSQTIYKPIMDLEDYKKSRIDPFEILGHLIIVVDEFAELKRQEPDFLKELISLSRIGRSLGIHLILSTQKPSGVIDEEIWANCHFKIALKVQDERDSKEVIKSEKAAHLKKPGEFYCLVDQNLFFVEALYTRIPLYNEDYHVSLLDDKWQKTHEFKNNQSFETELDYVLKDLVLKEKPAVNFLLEKPKAQTVHHLKKKYKLHDEWIIGEYDDYLNQRIGPIILKEKRILVVGGNMEHFMNHYQLKKQMVLIGESDYRHPCLSDTFSYEEDDYEYLYEKINEDKKEDLLLVYQNLNQLFTYKEDYQQVFLKLHRKFEELSMIAFVPSLNLLPARILQMFQTKIYYGKNPGEYFSLFESSMVMKGDQYINLEDVYPFVEAISKPFYKRIQYRPYLLHIPQKRHKKLLNGQILLGYDTKKREEIYLSNTQKCIVTSFHQELLEAFFTLYPIANFECIHYQVLKKEYYTNLLFIGPGIFHQSLFFIKTNEDLKEDEAIYYREGVYKKLKLVNHE